MSAKVTVRPLNPALWLGAPMVLCAGASLIFALPLRVGGMQLPEPVFALIPVFAWAVIRPSFLPPFALLILGLFLDLLWGGPLGLWPLCLLAAYAPVLFSRRFLAGQNYFVLWAWYAASCALAFLVGFLFTGVTKGAFPGVLWVVCQFLVTAMLFPFAGWLIQRYEDADVRFR